LGGGVTIGNRSKEEYNKYNDPTLPAYEPDNTNTNRVPAYEPDNSNTNRVPACEPDNSNTNRAVELNNMGVAFSIQETLMKL
jgi:hypothetical protein